MFKFDEKNSQLWFDDLYVGEVSKTEEKDVYKKCNFIVEEVNSEVVEKIYSLKQEDLLEDFAIYLLDESFTLQKKENKAFVIKHFTYFLEEWDKDISLKYFLDNFPKFIENDNSFEFNNDGQYFMVTVEFELIDGSTIKESLVKIDTILNSKIDEFIHSKNINKIINFSSEHLIAGISILQYFGKLLQEKYPNEKVSVSIKQEDLKVTMVIETPDGKKEEIEEYLNRYGMVITNQITPQEFATNPIQLIELKQELREAENKILFQQELLSLKDDTYKNRIISLEDEVNFLRKEFSEALLTNKENIQILLNSLLTKDKLIKKLTKSIESRNDIETKQLLLELKEKDSKGYISLKQHIDNAIIGGIVNAPSWIQFTVGILSKVG
jgi:hypothetical protein